MPAKKFTPKRIVYLWGAGATQGEAQNLGSKASLLMSDSKQFGEGITTRILRRAGARASALFGAGESVDIEKLISLLTVSGIAKHQDLAEDLRRHYFDELRESLIAAMVIDSPQLAIQLLEMHNDSKFEREVEALSGIITTNHDGLLQIAYQTVFGCVNLGLSFDSEDFAPTNSRSIPLLVQLHGSFTWQFGVPMRVDPLMSTSKYSPDTVWIPPTTAKESKYFPFNKLAALAYELLAQRCDVLRVIGASLTQNDWNVLSLIFNAQRHREFVKGAAFKIELIMPPDFGQRISEECAYLRHLTPIAFLSDGDFGPYKDQPITPESDMANPFGYWVNKKSEFHRTRGEFDGVDALSLESSHAEEAE